MTFFRKYMVLVVGGAIALVLVILVSALMFKFSSEYARVQSDLQTLSATLDRLHHRDPFPAEDNVARVRENLDELEEYLGTLLGALSMRQVQGEDMERAAFPAEIERTGRRLRAAAAEHEIGLADGLAFGFERYAAGNLPMQEHVSRLVVQLRTIETLCSLLFNAGISELVGVEREVFDVERTQAELMDPASMRRSGRAPAVVAAPATTIEAEGVEGLYTKERYTLTFFASDQALRDALNSMIRSPMLIIIRHLELRNEMGLGGVTASARLAARLQPRDAARPTMPRQPDAARDAAPSLLRDDRLVAGRERVRVTMIVDVYRFVYDEEVEETP